MPRIDLGKYLPALQRCLGLAALCLLPEPPSPSIAAPSIIPLSPGGCHSNAELKRKKNDEPHSWNLGEGTCSMTHSSCRPAEPSQCPGCK